MKIKTTKYKNITEWSTYLSKEEHFEVYAEIRIIARHRPASTKALNQARDYIADKIMKSLTERFNRRAKLFLKDLAGWATSLDQKDDIPDKLRKALL